MIYDRLRVFVSSKMAELAEERAAIKQVLDELNIDAWVFEQDAGARPESIQDSYTEQLEASDLYLGVFWKGYGDYTVDEFEHAKKVGKDCLVYQKGGDRTAGRDPQLESFLARLGKVETGLTVQFFDTADQLREMVKRDAARWQMRIVRKYRESGPKRQTGLPIDPNLAILRNKVQQFWIDGVLGRAIDVGSMDLEKQPESEATEQRWEAVLELPFEGSRIVDPATSVVDIFDQLQSSLLVLGQPGSGKTTTVLQLARDLIQRSENDGTQPVPVVLNLSTWSPRHPSLLSWITKEISAKYMIPAHFSRPWLEHGRLVLILDGLDEVPATAREECAATINRFCSEYGHSGLVVTSRLEEYNALGVRLRTNGAVCLQPLSSSQIDTYLDDFGPELDGLRTVLGADKTLQELARSPLMLSVMSVAYRGRSAAELERESGSAERRRAGLFATYVDRAFEEPATAKSYSREATTSWLSWIAKRMALRNQTVFLIEEMQPAWLERRIERVAYLAGFALLFGFQFAALCILYRLNPSVLKNSADFGKIIPPSWSETIAWFAACTTWLLGIGLSDTVAWRRVKGQLSGAALWRRVLGNLALYGLFWVPILVVFFALVDLHPDDVIMATSIAIALTVAAAAFSARRSVTSIRTTESLRLDWHSAGRGAFWGLPAGLVFGAILFFLLPGRDLAPAAVWPLLTAALGAILGGLVPRVVKAKTVPNQGMLLTSKTALGAGRLAILLVIPVLIFCLLMGGDYLHPPLVAIWTTGTFLFFFVCLATWFGGLDLGKHLVLRWLIGLTRQGPYDFARLLNDSTRRNLTQRVGGGYMFVHRLMLDHFAALDLPPPAADDVLSDPAEGRIINLPTLWMALLSLAGGLVLLSGLVNETRGLTWVGAIALAIGAQWLVIRTAVISALRTIHRQPMDE